MEVVVTGCTKIVGVDEVVSEVGLMRKRGIGREKSMGLCSGQSVGSCCRWDHGYISTLVTNLDSRLICRTQ